MHIYFCGIGGAGLAPLAELSIDCGFTVSGSDREHGLSISQLQKRGIEVSFNQDGSHLLDVYTKNPVHWFVHSSAVGSTHLEFLQAQELGIKISKRDGLLNEILRQKNLKLMAVAGTHGKTTTTAMIVWLFKQCHINISYSIGTNISFGPAAEYQADSNFFVYECDEFDRNFLHFNPYLSLIPSLDYDHPDTYLTEESYFEAFQQFILQTKLPPFLYSNDAKKLPQFIQQSTNLSIINEINLPHQLNISAITLPGLHNRKNAYLAVQAVHAVTQKPIQQLIEMVSSFPGTQRRLEKITPNIYTDYAHHPSEILATIQAIREIMQPNQQLVVVYQPHQNVRQHLIASQYQACFSNADKVFWLPTYLSREDENLPILLPQQLVNNLQNTSVEIADLNLELAKILNEHSACNNLILFMGAGSVDGWARDWATT